MSMRVAVTTIGSADDSGDGLGVASCARAMSAPARIKQKKQTAFFSTANLLLCERRDLRQKRLSPTFLPVRVRSSDQVLLIRFLYRHIKHGQSFAWSGGQSSRRHVSVGRGASAA